MSYGETLLVIINLRPLGLMNGKTQASYANSHWKSNEVLDGTLFVGLMRQGEDAGRPSRKPRVVN